jgi:diacylglycerol kinase family enzyme
LLDITIIRNIGRLEVLRNIPRLFNGTIGKNPKVELIQGKTVNVFGESPFYLEADGETLGHSPLYFSILPLSVNMFISHQVH